MSCKCEEKKCGNNNQKAPYSILDFDEYTYWKSLENREIVLNNEIDEFLVERAILQIIGWNREDNGLSKEDRKPIKIYIYSNGGDVIAGLGLVDTIKNSKTPVHTICLGLAASMGAILLIAGHHRSINKNSTVLLHDGNLHVANSSKKAKQTMAFFDQLEARLKKFTLENTKISEEMYDEKSDEEWYLFGDQCLELGIVDALIE